MNNNTGQLPPKVGRISLTRIVLALLAISVVCFVALHIAGGIGSAAAASVAPPPPVPLKPGDDPAYDWERPGRPHKTDSGDWTPFVKPTFASSRTLQQTTNWLSWALVSYGRVQKPDDLLEVSDVRFAGCSMRVDEKRFINEGKYMNETIYTVDLGQLDLFDVQAYGDQLHMSPLGARGFRKMMKLWEKDGSRMKPRAPDSAWEEDPSVGVFVLQEKDDIARRAGWAMVHAATLCGAKVRQ